ncbi:MAG: hypothetical protein PGMFKBFP_00209 [Anaerolineales bacterium]|jgi:hypothetical protein|nr:hypothetical protein [Anaerolineales bacterium]GER79336.1 conserved hypothetical protein [Candidatus Denitrolinea symbiosum]
MAIEKLGYEFINGVERDTISLYVLRAFVLIFFSVKARKPKPSKTEGFSFPKITGYCGAVTAMSK